MSFLITVQHGAPAGIQTRLWVNKQNAAEAIVSYCIANGFGVMAQKLNPWDNYLIRDAAEKLRAETIWLCAKSYVGKQATSA